MSFCNAVSVHPVCAPYRASLFTGKYTTSTGMVINELRMNPNHECIGHVLTKADYETAYIGNWHLWANELGNHYDLKNSYTPPGPHRLGFDGFWAAYNFHHLYYETYYHTNSPEKITMKGYEPDGQTDMAIRLIQEYSSSQRPFALFLSYGTPHDPWNRNNVPEEYYRMFEKVEFSAGIRDNTIFVFTSDHGEMFGAQGRRAKNIFYEEAVRVPFLIRWPDRIPAGHVSDACLNTPDIMPTLLSLMDLPIPSAVEGMDLSHCAKGHDGPEPEAALMECTGATAAWKDGHEWRALRSKRYTYAIFRSDRHEFLFDNVNDPYQLTNLVEDPGYKEVLDHFRKMLKAKMDKLNDTFESCTWYRDHWSEDRIILRSATLKG